MPIGPGARIGPYEVTALLGEGGMGQVWRAHHTALRRDDALKVLPDGLATDHDRLSRFQREAQVLASLNHPNIAHVYGLEHTGDAQALVMELVEGPTLADRIAEGPIPVDEALSIAKQVADALEAAHEHGVVHRDLKPANVKLRADGTVKVLDFGLAKVLEAVATTADVSQSPTITSPAVTRMGVILGTAAYLSPEQARGRQVDRRADIWAFGCVLFELLTGRRAFDAESIPDALVSILTAEPAWSALPPMTPSQIRTLLARCLQKETQKRLPHIGVAKLEIEDALAALHGRPSTSAIQPSGSGRLHRVALWAMGIVAVAATAALALVWTAPSRPAPAAPLQRLSIKLGTDASLATNDGPAVALSPDGRTLALVVAKSGVSQLYVRRLDQLEATPLAGTSGARAPFFSPDGRWIGFFASGTLKKIATSGGAAITLSPGMLGGAWGNDGIVFSPGISGPLARVSSDGGTPKPLTALSEGERTHRWPQLLPGERAVLYTVSNSAASTADGTLVVQTLPTGARTILQKGATYGRFLPSGHVVYVHDGTLFAFPFDPVRLEALGAAVPVLEGVTTINSGVTFAAGAAQFAVADTGTLIYLPGRSLDTNAAPLMWMDRSGKTTVLRAMPADWSNATFSPDGRRLAMDIIDNGNTDIWIYDVDRDQISRLTSDPGDDLSPTWTPDGRRVVFSSTRGSTVPNLYWQAADGSDEATRLTDAPFDQFATSWHPSGKFLAFRQVNPQSGSDVMILPLEGSESAGWKPGTPTTLLNSRFEERMPEFSPDGRWLAYVSNESGRYEVYVRPFPGPGSKWPVSVSGSTGIFGAVWSRVRNELLFETPDARIMAVSYASVKDSFRVDKPRLWSDTPHLLRPRWRSFDLHSDGQRVVTAPVPETPTTLQDTVVLVSNFFDEIRRLTVPSR